MFTPNTPLIETESGAPLSSAQFNQLFTAVYQDMQALKESMNNVVEPALGQLQSTGLASLEDDGVAGTTIFTDPQAGTEKDYGLFWNDSQNRPYSVYESFLIFARMLSGLENANRQGVRVGGGSAPGSMIVAGEYLELDWPYNDGIFVPLLFSSIGGGMYNQIASSYEIRTYPATGKLRIINTDAIENIYVFGYIWHPTFPF